MGTCLGCGSPVESHCNMCEACARAIEHEEEIQREERARWEREQMDEHFRKYPHG